MIEFKENTPKIFEVYQYTYRNRHTQSRFRNEERDMLKTRVSISRRIVYKKNKEGKWTAPSTLLVVRAISNPQYGEYLKVKSKNAKRQKKIKHPYDCFIAIQDTEKGYDFWNSKIIWRTGSQKKYPKYIPQSKVKQIHKETRERLERKYSKLPKKEKDIKIKKELDKIRKSAPYISDADYIAQELGIFLDSYFRDFYIMNKFQCLYGRDWYNQSIQGINYPYFDKVILCILNFLLRKGIVKYK